MTRDTHIANGPLVASVRNFVAARDRDADGEELDAIIAVTDGGTLTLHALRTLLAEHDAYRSEARAASDAETAVRVERSPGNIAPAWAYDLLIAVLNYEDVHGSHADGWTCFGVLVNTMVPPDQIEKARFIDAYWGQKEPK